MNNTTHLLHFWNKLIVGYTRRILFFRIGDQNLFWPYSLNIFVGDQLGRSTVKFLSNLFIQWYNTNNLSHLLRRLSFHFSSYSYKIIILTRNPKIPEARNENFNWRFLRGITMHTMNTIWSKLSGIYRNILSSKKNHCSFDSSGMLLGTSIIY